MTRIPHDGGPCPVPLDTQVLVEFEDGYIETLARDDSSEAGYWADDTLNSDNWRIRNGASGIVAYWIVGGN